MPDERLRLTAEMRDRLTPALRRLQTVMAATGRSAAFQKLARDMSRLERAGYRASFAIGRTLRISTIAAAGAATVASYAMIRLGKTAVDSLDDLKAFSGQVGMSADGLRLLEGVADRFNVSQESLRSGLQSFNARLGQLKSGQGAFLGFLTKTNPALAAQMKHVKSTEQGYILLFDALAKISDPNKRAALAKASGIGQESLRFLADGPEGLRKTILEVRKLLGVLGPEAYDAADNFNDAMGDVGLALQGLSAKMAVSVLPTLTPMLQDLANFLATNRDRISAGFKQVVGDIATALQGFGRWIASSEGSAALQAFWTDLKDIASALAEVAKAVNTVVQAMGGWKVVIAGIAGLKAVSVVKGLVGGVVPGGNVAGAAAGAAGAAAGAAGWLGKGGGVLRFAGRMAPWLAALAAAAEILPQLPGFAELAAGKGHQSPLGNRDPWDVQRRRNEIAGLEQRAAKMDDELKQWRASGHDKSEPGRFADFAKRRSDLIQQIATLRAELAKIMDRDAKSLGRKIGEEAGDSLYKRMMLFLGTGGSGGGMQQAVYRTAGPAIAATRAAFGGGKGMLDLIAAAEGTGSNYNETLGYGRLTGGKVNLTGMTLDQVDALQTRMLRHPANKWNSSALGRYQFVRTRLRDLRARYGIPGSALFSPNLQDQLAKLSLAERGGSIRGLRNEWQGLNRVPATILRDAIRDRDRRREARPAGRIEGSASLDIRFPNGMPAGTRVGSKVAGLFREVNLDTGRAMVPA